MGTYKFPELEYTKDWRVTNPNDPKYLPTYESSETRVREDMQRPFEELKENWNGPLKAGIEKYLESFGGVKPKGTYSPTERYEFRDLVVYNGHSYIAVHLNAAGEKEDFTGVTPGSDTTYWQIFLGSPNVDIKSASFDADGSAPALNVTKTEPDGNIAFALAFSGLGKLPILRQTAEALGIGDDANLDAALNKLLSLLSRIQELPFVCHGTYPGSGKQASSGDATEISFPAKPIFVVITGHPSSGADPQTVCYLTDGSPVAWRSTLKYSPSNYSSSSVTAYTTGMKSDNYYVSWRDGENGARIVTLGSLYSESNYTYSWHALCAPVIREVTA